MNSFIKLSFVFLTVAYATPRCDLAHLLSVASDVTPVGIKGCGLSHNERLDLRSGPLSSLQSPWTASIVLQPDDDSNRTSLRCSGSILNEKFVLTSANCVVGDFAPEISKMTVIVGANEPTNPEHLKKIRRFIQKKKISSVKIHPQYDQVSGSAKYDLALVEIQGTFRFRNTIRPICIPGKALPKEYHFDKGYTLLSYGSEDDGHALISKPLTVQPTKVCNALYAPILDNPDSEFHDLFKQSLPNNFDEDSIICGQGDPTCVGDSGGMLVKKVLSEEFGRQQAVQQALVLGNVGSCDTRFLDIFVRLDTEQVLSWILDNVNFDGEIDECVYNNSCGTGH